MLPPVPFSQRWNEGLPSWKEVDGEPFIPRRYEVSVLSEDTTAKRFIERHHYSHKYVAALFRCALHYGDQLVGAFILASPSNEKVLTNRFPGLVPYKESQELARFVLLDSVPFTAESWFLAQCFQYARAAGIKGIVSFSDPVPRIGKDGSLLMPGHIGTIYQASNAYYFGRGTARRLTLLPDGQVLSDRAIQKIRRLETGHEYVERDLVKAGARVRDPKEDSRVWLKEALRAVKIYHINHPGNYCYGFLLDQRAKAAMNVPLFPMVYPKKKQSEPSLILTVR